MKKGLGILTILVMGLGAFAQNPCANLPQINTTITDPTPCLGDTITATGQAAGASSYFWSGGVVNGQAFVPSQSDTLRLIVSYPNGCKDTVFRTVEVLPLPNVTANSSSLTTCKGDSVTLNATGAASYKWLVPQIPNNSVYVTDSLGANKFLVEGTGANGCKNTSQVIVVVKRIPVLPVLSTDSISTCVEVDFAEEITSTTKDGVVIWYKDKGLTQKHQQEGPLQVQTSPVGTQEYFATSHLSGCFSAPVRAVAHVLPRPIIDAGEDLKLEANQTGNFSPSYPEGSTALWSPAENLSDVNDPTTEAQAKNTTTYTLLITDKFGCESTDTVQVIVDAKLTISNMMSPNGDGNNDTWKVYPEVLLEKCDVKLFDGFGRVLLETSDYQNDWGGEFEGETLPAGNYYYQITGPNVDEKGTITLMR